MDDIASGVVKFLSALTDVTAGLGSFPANDPNTTLQGKPWIFKDDLLVVMEGQSVFYSTLAIALVCSDGGGWSEPSPLTTPRFNRLKLDIHVDSLRDSGHSIAETSGEPKSRGKALFTLVNTHLHRINPDMQLWGDLRTVGCQLLTEPSFVPMPDGDGVYTGTAYYGVSVFGATDTVT
jgi:hypothetical protein